MEETTTCSKRLSSLFRTLTSRLLSLFVSDPQLLPTLPSDVIAEILCRLPGKQLMQLRCLCKSFNSLISHPNFVKKHLLHMSTTRHHHLILEYRQEVDGIEKSGVISYPLLSILEDPVTVEPTKFDYHLEQGNKTTCCVIGSCNGLVCLVFSVHPQFLSETDVFLWNPTIAKFNKFLSHKDTPKCIATICGFGYDSVNHVYKVLGSFFCSCDGDFQNRVKVHTLGTASWRMTDRELRLPSNELMKFVSGALNWIQYLVNDDIVVSFDLVNESYRKLLLPNYGGEHVNNKILGVLSDSLSICARSHTFSTIWLMKEYGNQESWTKLFRFPNLENPEIKYPLHFYYQSNIPQWVFEDDQVLMLRRTLTVYDSKNGTFKMPMVQNINNRMIYDVYVCVAVESLVSPCF